MPDMDLNTLLKGRHKRSVLTEILVHSGEEAITDEQVQRVLDPVLKMIYEGRFEGPHTIDKRTRMA